MRKIISHIATLFLSALSILPMPILYLKSNVCFFLIYYLIGYRKKVVFNNLNASFPDKSEQEIKTIAKSFYKHLCDVTVETIKLRWFSVKSLKKRLVVTNPELVNQYYEKGRSVIVLTMHYNNWEWQVFLQQYIKHRVLMVYNPARNLVFDSYITKMRSRFGSSLISTKKILNTVLKAQKNNELTFTWLCADQRAKWNTRFWTTFLNQEAGFFPGPENLARHTNQVVIYQHVEKIRRGYYQSTFEVITENPSEFPADGLLKLYVNKIESIIKERPEFYLWSHKRWKHKRPADTPLQNRTI